MTLLALSISNLTVHFQDVDADNIAGGLIKSQTETFGDVFKRYPMSLILCAYAFLVSLTFFLFDR